MARTDVESLVLVMSVDINKLNKQLAAARGQTSRELSKIEQRFDQMNAHVSRTGDDMAANLKRSIAAIGVTFAVRELGNYADAWTNLRNTVRQYTAVLGPVDQATSRFVDISNQSGVALDALSGVFGGASRAAIKLGRDGEDVYRFMEAVSKGSAIANTGTAAVDGAMRQLSQSIGSPIVQLGEFNSIIEGTPRLAQAFADGVTAAGGDLAKLRQLIGSGEVSGQELFDGLISQLGKLRGEFSQVDTTIGRAITTLQNATIEYVGTVDQNLGASQKLVGLIEIIASNLDLLAAAAVAAAIVLGGQGVAGALTEVSKQVAATQAAFAAHRDELGANLLAIRAQTAAQSKAAAEQLSIMNVQRRMRDQALEAVLASSKLSDAYHAELKAVQEVARAKKALEAANIAAAKSEAPRMLAQTQVTLATHRLQEAEAHLAILRKQAPAELAAYTAASRALGASQIALTAQQKALADSQAKLAAASAAASGVGRTLGTAIRALGVALSGPLGAVALIGVLTFVMKGLGDASKSASARIDDASAAFERVRTIQSKIEGDTKRLKEISDGLEESIRKQGEAARITADKEIGAINDRIAKNKELAELYRLQATRDLAIAEKSAAADRKRLNRKLAGLAGNAPLGDVRTLGNLDTAGVVQAAIDEARRAAIRGAANSTQRAILDAATDLAELEAELSSLRAVAQGISPDTEPASTGGVSGGGSGDAKSKLRAFQLPLEDLNATLKEIRASKEADAVKSRAAVQALLDYARAVESTKAALDEVPSLSDVLDAKDLPVLERQLEGLAIQFGEVNENGLQASLDAMNEGVAQAMEDLEAWEPDLSWINTDLVEQLTAAYIKFRDGVREGLKEGLRQGIETDDWGGALRSLIARAVTAGFDDALNRAADILTDLFLGNGKSNGWVASIGKVFGFGRAIGGQGWAGQTYRINEGQSEFLHLGKNGQILNMDQMGKLFGAGSKANNVTINAPLVVQGDLADATLGKVRAMMDSNNQRILAAMPAVVTSVNRDNAIRRRR